MFKIRSWCGEEVSPKRLSRINTLKKRLVNKETKQEKIFKQHMSKYCKKGTPIWFTPQKAVHVHQEQAFILDFYFKQFKLCIEIDGDCHTRRKSYDNWRSEVLATKKIEVMRFSNDRIENDIDAVVFEVLLKLKEIALKSKRKWLIQATAFVETI